MYYFIFHAATGSTSVDTLEKKPGKLGRERLLYLETNRDGTLDRTVKHDEILIGAFGTLYASKTCFYGRPLKDGYSSVSVGSYSNHLEHEKPVQLSNKPDKPPPLTSLSLVRIFHTGRKYSVISANYEPSGKLGSIHIDGTTGGDWVSGEAALYKGANEPRLDEYGIPVYVDVQENIRSGHLVIPVVSLPEELTLIINIMVTARSSARMCCEAGSPRPPGICVPLSPGKNSCWIPRANPDFANKLLWGCELSSKSFTLADFEEPD